MQAFRDIFRINWYWFIIISTLHNMLEMMMKGEKIDTPRKRQKVCKKVKWEQNCGKVLPGNSSQRLACHQWSTSHTHTLSHSSPHANPFPHPKNVFSETYFSSFRATQTCCSSQNNNCEDEFSQITLTYFRNKGMESLSWCRTSDHTQRKVLLPKSFSFAAQFSSMLNCQLCLRGFFLNSLQAIKRDTNETEKDWQRKYRAIKPMEIGEFAEKVWVHIKISCILIAAMSPSVKISIWTQAFYIKFL